MNNNQRVQTLSLVVVLLLASFSLLQSSGGGPSCNNPPLGNPNTCHVYTWNNFPLTFGTVPNTSLFNNDTSYWFIMNVTNIVAFSICTIITHMGTEQSGLDNATLTLQYLDTNVNWVNVDTSSSKTGGSLSLNNDLVPPDYICSSTLGYFPSPFSCAPAVIGNSIIDCLFRIAGNEGANPFSPLPSSNFIQLQQLSVTLYLNIITLFNPIVCTAITISTTGFTNKCSRAIITTSQSFTVKWEANNLGVGFQSGSVTCSFAVGTNSCTNSVTFSPSFATTPSVTESWSNTIGSGTATLSPSFVFNVLT